MKHINSHLNLSKLIECSSHKNRIAKNNLLQFRFLAACGTFSTLYGLLIHRSQKSENEIVRIAASGSLTFLICEIFFFPMEAINLQQKICKANFTSY